MKEQLDFIAPTCVENEPGHGHFELSIQIGEQEPTVSQVPALDFQPSTQKAFIEQQFTGENPPHVHAHRCEERGMAWVVLNRSAVSHAKVISRTHVFSRGMTIDMVHEYSGAEAYDDQFVNTARITQSDIHDSRDNMSITGVDVETGLPFNASVRFFSPK